MLKDTFTNKTVFRQQSIQYFFYLIFFIAFFIFPNTSLAKDILMLSVVPIQYVHNDKIDTQYTYGIMYFKKITLNPYMNLLLGIGAEYTEIKSDDSTTNVVLNQYAISVTPKIGLSVPIYKDTLSFNTGFGVGFQYEEITRNTVFNNNYTLDGELFTGISFQYKYFYSAIEHVFTQRTRSRGITVSIGVVF